MSTIIRLSIVGKIHQRTYRVVAQDKKSKRDGKFLEIVGNINPNLEPTKQIVLKKDRISYWQKNGAQLSPTVKYILKNGKLPPRPKKERKTKDKPAVSTPNQQAQSQPAQNQNAKVENQNQEGSNTESQPNKLQEEVQEIKDNNTQATQVEKHEPDKSD